MGRIRLQIHILPLRDSGSTSNLVQSTRQEVILPWTEPCPEDLTIQELSEKIVSSFASIHPNKGYFFHYIEAYELYISWTNSFLRSTRVLNLHHVEDFYGGALQSSLTVGDCFDDRSNSTKIENSIVKAFRFPPTASELDDPLWFAPLAPESSARIQKRRLAHCAPLGWEIRHNGDDAQPGDSDLLTADDSRASKRRKIEHPLLHSVLDPDPSIISHQGFENRVNGASWVPARYLSPALQIADSQESPSRKRKYHNFRPS